MNRIAVTSAVGLLALSQFASAAPEVVACDLFDEATISKLIGVKTTQAMNRDKQKFDGVKISTCMHQADRHSVMIVLAEYPSETEARKAYAVARKDAGQAKVAGKTPFQYKVEDEAAIGEKAYWYQLDSDQFGITAIKGSRGISVNFQFSDSASGMNVFSLLKERSRPAVQAAIRKL